MTNRERQIFDLIRENPNISQKEISDTLKISRTSVAVHITHLLEKGYILGRQYILKENANVLVIGACNLDIQGLAIKDFNVGDSNIGNIKMGFGGVARNIAINLSKLSSNVKILTVLSTDENSKKIKKELDDVNIDTSDILYSDKQLSTYLSIQDNKSNLIAGIADMDIVNDINVDYLSKKLCIIQKHEIIVIDTNLSKEAITYILDNKVEGQKIVVDTVSIEKAKKLIGIIGKVDIVKTNKLELEALCGRQLKNMKEIKEVCTDLINQGVKKIFVTLGAKGLILVDDKKSLKLANPKNIQIVDITGAGDIFTAALVYTEMQNYSIEKAARFAQTSSIIKIGQYGTTPEKYSVSLVNEYLDKYFKNGGIK